MMKFIQLSLAAAILCVTSHAFSISSPAQTTRARIPIYMTNNGLIPTENESIATTTTSDEQKSKRYQLQQFTKTLLDRMDTMKSAGLYSDDNNDGLVPMEAGFKTNVGLLLGAFLFKWYRARFITKIPVWDRQPQWNMVVTSPEQEKELHAYQCKKCGSTIFIARHREWFFKGGNTECTNCGATGKENFIDIRDDVIDEIDDDYFDYPSPLDYVSAAEKRRLVKEAGGDEELAKKIAIEKALKDDPKQIQVEEGKKEEEGGEVKKKKSSKKKKKSVEASKADAPESEASKAEAPKAEAPKAKAPKKEAPKPEAPKKAEPPKIEDDILDELDMDF